MKKQILICFIVLNFSLTIKGEIISVNQKIFKDTIIDVSLFSNLCSFDINGKSVFYSENAYVRVILEDKQKNKYLVYDGSILLSGDKIEYFKNYSFETYSLNNINAFRIHVQFFNASINLESFTLKQTLNKNDCLRKVNMKTHLDSILKVKLNNVQNFIINNKMLWNAEITPMAKMSYNKKIKLFGDPLPNLQGFEFYEGGIFEMLPREEPAKNNHKTLINNFDWRNRHNANSPDSPYWSGDDNNYSGWVASRHQTQSCNDCWLFSPVYTLQTLVNLYYNDHIDINLSQQNILSCVEGAGHCAGGWQSRALNYMRDYSIVTEECFPYEGTDITPCENICENPNDAISFQSYQTISRADKYLIKKAIIEKGPLASGVSPWSHAMSLIGYGIIEEGSLYLDGTSGHTGEILTVPANSPLIGRTYWIFKQSWGSWINDTPYVYVVMNVGTPSNFITHYALNTPIASNVFNQDSVRCVDKDGDGFYNWGIGPKPTTCPPWTPDEPDGDDSNPYLGPMDENGHLIPIIPITCDDLHVTSNSTWLNNIELCGNLIIRANSTLTIKGQVIMPNNSKIRVQDGAKLILDAGMIINGNIQVESGCSFTVKNNGIVEMNFNDRLNMKLGSTANIIYGSFIRNM